MMQQALVVLGPDGIDLQAAGVLKELAAKQVLVHCPDMYVQSGVYEQQFADHCNRQLMKQVAYVVLLRPANEEEQHLMAQFDTPYTELNK